MKSKIHINNFSFRNINQNSDIDLNMFKKISKYQTLDDTKQSNIDENMMNYNDSIGDNIINRNQKFNYSVTIQNYQNYNLENTQNKFQPTKMSQTSTSPNKKIKDFNKKILKSRIKRYNDPEDHDINLVNDVN